MTGLCIEILTQCGPGHLAKYELATSASVLSYYPDTKLQDPDTNCKITPGAN